LCGLYLIRGNVELLAEQRRNLDDLTEHVKSRTQGLSSEQRAENAWHCQSALYQQNLAPLDLVPGSIVHRAQGIDVFAATPHEIVESAVWRALKARGGRMVKGASSSKVRAHGPNVRAEPRFSVPSVLSSRRRFRLPTAEKRILEAAEARE
jgi:hypothetical protein